MSLWKTSIVILSLIANNHTMASAHTIPGMQAFQNGRFLRAVEKLRPYVRRHPSNSQAANILAAAYLHSGQPIRALRLLHRYQNRSPNIGYNIYYQGLSYQVLGQNEQAKLKLQYVSRFNDEYGQRATFQLAIIEYAEENGAFCRYWLGQYLQRFPNGFFRKRAVEMMRALDAGDYEKTFKGAQLPDLEKALFNFHRFSILKRHPHFWSFDSRYTNQSLIRQTPALDPSAPLRKEGEINHTLDLISIVGYGPYRHKENEFRAGYGYAQKWYSDEYRVSTWLEDPGDISYFPFRTDLLERQHHLFIQADRDFFQRVLNVGFYSSYTNARIGSSLLPSTDDSGIERTLDSFKQYYIEPWIKLKWNQVLNSRLFLYIRHQDSSINDAFSFKTFDLFGKTQAFSLGLDNTYLDRLHRFELYLNAYYLNFVFNDYFLDFGRTGASMGGEARVFNYFRLGAFVSYFQDTFTLPTIRAASCTSSDTTADETVGVSCFRVDTVLNYGVLASWHYSRFHRLGIRYSSQKRENSKFKNYNRNRNELTVEFSIAFPGTKKLEPIIESIAQKRIEREMP